MVLTASLPTRSFPRWALWLAIVANLLLAGALLFWPSARTPPPAPDLVCPLRSNLPGQPATIPLYCHQDRRTV